jgi:nucleotide-binding universal stress UspA family protein
MNSKMNILVATDFSQDSRKALDEAVQLARRLNSTIFLMHAINEVEQCAVDYCLSFEDVEATKNRLIQEAKIKLDGEVKRYAGERNVSIVPEVRYGHTYEEIVREESERNIDLLVVGQHDRKSLWKKMASHLSTRLANNPSRDTLVIPHAV